MQTERALRKKLCGTIIHCYTVSALPYLLLTLTAGTLVERHWPAHTEMCGIQTYAENALCS